MDSNGFYSFRFVSKPNERGEVEKYEIYFQPRRSFSIHNNEIFTSTDEKKYYFDSDKCEVSYIISTPDEYMKIGVNGSVDFLNDVIRILKENTDDKYRVWDFNKEYYDSSADEIYKPSHDSSRIKEIYNKVFKN